MKRSQYTGDSGKFRKKSNFESASAILEKAFRKYGLEDRVTKYKFVMHWPEIMGPAISQRSRPEYIRNKTLYIKVSDSGWAQELSFQKNVILTRLQRFLEKDTVVKEIRFFVGEIQ
jgi:predicted nucleic acid-binding Zn ribbon protein